MKITERVFLGRNLGAVCIVDCDNIAEEILAVIVVCAVIAESNYTVDSVIIKDFAVGVVKFSQNTVPVQGVIGVPLPVTNSICAVGKGYISVRGQLTNVRPSQGLPLVQGGVAEPVVRIGSADCLLQPNYTTVFVICQPWGKHRPNKKPPAVWLIPQEVSCKLRIMR